jgi:hypothetical protein
MLYLKFSNIILWFYPLISIYYGIFEEDVNYLYRDLTSGEKLLKNRLCGEGQNIRNLIIQRMELQIKVEIEINKKKPLFI